METHAEDLIPVEATGSAIAKMAERVGPAVVGLGRGWGLGSGVVVDRDRVITSAHAVRGDEATITFQDGRRASASVEGADPDRDVAVLSVDTAGAEPVEWGQDAGSVAIGTPVIALANPGGRGLRATLGFVSAAERRFRGLRGRRLEVGIEHTAPLPRGSSGGPLVDTCGRLVGLNTLRLEGGLVLAVAADLALRERCEGIARGQAAGPRRLGVALAPPQVARRMRVAVGLPERPGLLVRGVEDGSAAARAGVVAGDLIVGAGDREVAGSTRCTRRSTRSAPAASCPLRVVRGTEERLVTVGFDGGDGEERSMSAPADQTTAAAGAEAEALDAYSRAVAASPSAWRRRWRTCGSLRRTRAAGTCRRGGQRRGAHRRRLPAHLGARRRRRRAGPRRTLHRRPRARVLGGRDATRCPTSPCCERRPPTSLPAELGDAERLRVGQLVVAIGNPFGFAGLGHRRRGVGAGPLAARRARGARCGSSTT